MFSLLLYRHHYKKGSVVARKELPLRKISAMLWSSQLIRIMSPPSEFSNDVSVLFYSVRIWKYAF